MNAPFIPPKHYTEIEIPTRTDLSRLSRRALLALAARCVRRSQSLYQSRHLACQGALEQAISAAEQFTRGESFSVSGSQIKFAVKYAANRGSRYAAQAALYLAQATVIADQVESATDASNVVYKAWMAIAAAYNANPELSWLFAARDDFDYLSITHRGTALQPGNVINACADGPLGQLWDEIGNTVTFASLPRETSIPLVS